jgi:hypothetical protein
MRLMLVPNLTGAGFYARFKDRRRIPIPRRYSAPENGRVLDHMVKI